MKTKWTQKLNKTFIFLVAMAVEICLTKINGNKKNCVFSSKLFVLLYFKLNKKVPGELYIYIYSKNICARILFSSLNLNELKQARKNKKYFLFCANIINKKRRKSNKKKAYEISSAFSSSSEQQQSNIKTKQKTKNDLTT